jgi:hypothetical protein
LTRYQDRAEIFAERALLASSLTAKLLKETRRHADGNVDFVRRQLFHAYGIRLTRTAQKQNVVTVLSLMMVTAAQLFELGQVLKNSLACDAELLSGIFDCGFFLRRNCSAT